MVCSNRGARFSDSGVLYYLFPKTKMIEISNLKYIFVYCIENIHRTSCFNNVEKVNSIYIKIENKGTALAILDL